MESMEERLTMFYSEHAPEKVDNVLKLKKRFEERSRDLGPAGAEAELNAQLRGAYGADLGTRYTASAALLTSDDAAAMKRQRDMDQFKDMQLLDEPRDALDGIGSGLKSIGAGVAAGVAGLVAGPVIGAREGGVGGFFAGLGAGLATLAIAPVVGVGVGVRQVARGFMNTPETMKAQWDGKVYDELDKVWRVYDLTEEAHRVLNQDKASEPTAPAADADGSAAADGAAESKPKRPKTSVKDTRYYDLLGVETNADESEIKKAYYKAARKCHPDKNPDDEEAKLRFQQLGEAYQVLSNEQLRTVYDRDGCSGVKESENFVKIDPAFFFSTMFGSEMFESYIGELQLGTVAGSVLEDAMSGKMKGSADDIDMSKLTGNKDLAQVQRRREVQCALHLRDRLAPYIAGELHTFEEWAHKEAKKLVRASYGEVLLRTVGTMYQSMGEQYLGTREFSSAFSGLGASLRQSATSMGNKFDVARSVIGAVRQVGKMSKEAESSAAASAVADAAEGTVNGTAEGTAEGGAEAKPKTNEEEQRRQAEMMEQSLPLFLEAAFSYSKLDASNTCEEACKKVLRDNSATTEQRMQRARALVVLGKIFVRMCDEFLAAQAQAKGQNKDDPSSDKKAAKDAQHKLEEAMQAMYMKAHAEKCGDEFQHPADDIFLGMKPGQEWTVWGLKSKPELNGQRATVIEILEQGRVKVVLHDMANMELSVKAENLCK